MAAPGVRWWTRLVTLLTVVSVVTAVGVRQGLVVDVNTCKCTAGNETCVITEILNQHHPWDSSDHFPEKPHDLKFEVSDDNTPTMTITWLPPRKNASLLSGFFLDLNLQLLLSFQLLHVSVPADPNAEAQWKIACAANRIIYGKTLSVVAVSLPRPTDPSEFLRSTGSTVNIPLLESMKADNSYHWMPVVSVVPRGQSLVVQFPVPEQLKNKIKGFRIRFEPYHPDLIPDREVAPMNHIVHSEFFVPNPSKYTFFKVKIIKLCKDCRIGERFCQKSDQTGDCGLPRRISTKGSLPGTFGKTTTTTVPITEDDEMTTTGQVVSTQLGTFGNTTTTPVPITEDDEMTTTRQVVSTQLGTFGKTTTTLVPITEDDEMTTTGQMVSTQLDFQVSPKAP